MSDFLPAGRTPPSGLLSSESAAARALTGGWCRPCGVTGTVLWACQSCWRQHETCWCSASVSWHRSEPCQDLPLCLSSASFSAPSGHDLWTGSLSLRNWITFLVAVDRLSWLWLGVNGRTCLWTAPSRRPASAAPCAQKEVVKSVTLDYENALYSVWKGGFNGVGPFLDGLMHSFIPIATWEWYLCLVISAELKNAAAGVTNLVSVQLIDV